MFFYWQFEDSQLITDLYDGKGVNAIELPARDGVPVSIYLVDRADITVVFSPEELEANETIVFAGRATPGGQLLWQKEFTASDLDANTAYTAIVNLNTAELIAFLGTDFSQIVRGELTIKRADLSNKYSTSFQIVLKNDYVRTETDPDAAGSNLRIIEGILHLYNADQDLWFPLECNGNDGLESLSLGDDGVAQ